ncbi:MoaD/ThiS family protein [Thermodesulfobacteriota bacterium]
MMNTSDRPGAERKHLVLNEEIPEETTVKELLGHIADRYESIDKSISEALGQSDYPHFNVVINGRIKNTSEAMKKKLLEGDSIVVLPFLYGG